MLLLGDEFKVLRTDVQNSVRGVRFQRSRHPSFTGRQPVVTKGDIAVIRFDLRQIGSHRPTSPHREDRQVWPIIARPETPLLIGNPSQMTSPARIGFGNKRAKSVAEPAIDRELLAQSAIVYITQQRFLLTVTQ